MVKFLLRSSKKEHWIRKLAFLLIAFFLFFSNSSIAQHFVKMTDKQWVELALDMIRKGIQQQDTTKINMVVAQEVSIVGKGIETQATLSRKLQTIFNSSYKRSNKLNKPSFPRADNPLHLSGFWDFDILDPQITIDGDSAIAECELVLWGAPPDKGSDQAGRRIKERFVFKSPAKIEQPPQEGEVRKWPASSSVKVGKTSVRSWQLIEVEYFLLFLDGEIKSTAARETKN